MREEESRQRRTEAVWRNAPRTGTDRSALRGTTHIWERKFGGGEWKPLHNEAIVLDAIESSFLAGRATLPYSAQYKKPAPYTDNHVFVIDFDQMKQIDIYFPVDPRRTSSVRRRQF